jgi:hypothetical protein
MTIHFYETLYLVQTALFISSFYSISCVSVVCDKWSRIYALFATKVVLCATKFSAVCGQVALCATVCGVVCDQCSAVCDMM